MTGRVVDRAGEGTPGVAQCEKLNARLHLGCEHNHHLQEEVPLIGYRLPTRPHVSRKKADLSRQLFDPHDYRRLRHRARLEFDFDPATDRLERRLAAIGSFDLARRAG